MAEIAVAGAIAVLKQTVSILGNLVSQEGARLFTIKEEIGWVEREMGYIQSYLKNADSIGDGQENTVEAALVKDIRVLAYDVEDIVETYIPLIASEESMSALGRIKIATIGFLTRSDAALNFVKEIEVIKRRVDDIYRVRETYGTMVNNNGSSRVDIWEQRKHFLYLNESKVVGFSEHIKVLESKVLDPKLQHNPVISIVGMPGLGKTTLAKKVYNSVKSHFDCSAMVYVSQMPNISQILLEVAEQVGLEQKRREKNLEVNLHTHLEDKRYVIVFDDIWDSQAWDYLKICIPNNCINGSKIIITSRKTEVASQIGTVSSLYELKPWNTEDSWRFFQDLVITPFEDANIISGFHELESLGRKIVEKCGGVPLAIEAVAGLLLGKDATENEWKVVLKRMGQDEDNCSRVMRLSYKDLPTELKPCFLYFGFFPEDFEIYASDIINIWVAEGFVQGKRDREPEDIGGDYLNMLVARNMVQVSRRGFDGSIATCRVHDLWHSFCITVASEINFFCRDESSHQNNISETTMTRVSRVVISKNTIPENNICHVAGKLRALLYCHHNCNDKIALGFFKGSKCLRVLMVEFDDIPSGFLKGIGSLTNLKYFRFLESRKGMFGKDFIRLPPNIGNLKSLITLDLRNVVYMNFPDEIWQLKHLRHILLDTFLGSRKKYNLLSRKLEVVLPNLQTLHVVHAYALEAEYISGFPNLRKLGISRPTDSMIKVLSDVKPISNKLLRLSLLYCSISVETPLNLNEL